MRIYAKIHKLIDIKKEMGKKDCKQAVTKGCETQPHGLGLRQLGCRT